MTESRRQQLLHAIVDAWDHQFDPGTGLLPPPASLSCNLYYALALLETAERSRMGRAEALVRRIASSQPPSAAHACGDIGVPLLLIWHRHHLRLSSSLQPLIIDTLRQTASAPPDAANRAIPPTPASAAAIFIQLAVAELTYDAPLLASALPRFQQLCDALENGRAPAPPAFADFLLILHTMENHLQSPGIAARLVPVLLRLWDTLDLSSSLRSPILAILIERATPGPVAAGPLEKSPLDIPSLNAAALLHSLTINLNFSSPLQAAVA
ncbi:hypothetical protein OPIT5_14260 [Opitutaceae bacterium TAV5]|nr:hypothetical protein OPIT5_14260 [Opitutaceae bacterium TAV5]